MACQSLAFLTANVREDSSSTSRRPSGPQLGAVKMLYQMRTAVPLTLTSNMLPVRPTTS